MPIAQGYKRLQRRIIRVLIRYRAKRLEVSTLNKHLNLSSLTPLFGIMASVCKEATKPLPSG